MKFTTKPKQNLLQMNGIRHMENGDTLMLRALTAVTLKCLLKADAKCKIYIKYLLWLAL